MPAHTYDREEHLMENASEPVQPLTDGMTFRLIITGEAEVIPGPKED